MAIRIPTSDQSKIYIGTQEIGAVYVGANKVWPDAPVSQFRIVHSKQTNFQITITCSTYNTVTINWGDGSTELVNNGTYRVHTYSTAGNHEITVTGIFTNIIGVSCYDQFISQLQFHAEMNNVTSIYVGGNSFSTFDFSMCTKFLNLGLNVLPSLTTIIQPTSVSTSGSRSINIQGSALTSYSLPGGITTLSSFLARSCSSLTSINLYGLTTVTDSVQFYSCNSLISVNLGSLVNCSGYIYGYSCPQLISVNISSLQTVGDLYIYATACKTINISTIQTATSIYLVTNGANQSQVDAWLSQAQSITDNSVDFRIQGNAAPSTAGYAIAAALRARGWTVLTS
jgi:hypothetical protein